MRAAFARGDHATWGYDEGYARAASDPAAIFPQAARVLCVAAPYATPPPRTQQPLRGRVSNYAWSTDYHRTLREWLDQLAALLNEHAGSPVAKVVCDTAPIAERAWAAASGLGWIGKHTSLISPSAGSYVFLGEILTSLELPIDAPLEKSCGNCTRCITGCPTGALRGDYTIDATRCIADLSQRTDPIPMEMRALCGTWVWGCDTCAVVCPPNQQAKVHGGPAFVPLDDDLAQPDLTALLRMKSGEFKRRYRHSAMGWRGAAVLRRNAAIALGNALDRSTVPVLAEALRDDPHPMVRGAVAWALGRIASPGAMRALGAALASERDEGVLIELSSALRSSTGTSTRPAPLEHTYETVT